VRLPQGSRRGFGLWDIPTLLLGIALAWSIAAANHFSGAWLFFAVILTVAFLVGFLRRAFRL
jgi:hypothetical protein